MIKQAIIPAAGLGSRFLPVTRIVPKELLPIMAKPAMQYIVEELVQSGIEEIILVLSPEKESIYRYFSEGGFIDQLLDERGHEGKLAELRDLLRRVTFRRVYQHNPLGLGHAILCAQKAICTDTFAVVLPDDIVFADQPCMQQLVDAHHQTGHSMVAIEEVPDADVSAYGIVQISSAAQSNMPFQIQGVVEKPDLDQAPSNLAIIGRYILSNNIFDVIPESTETLHQEIQLTDALKIFVDKGVMSGLKFKGRRIDVGQPIGFTKANLMVSLSKEKHARDIKQFAGRIGLT